MSSCVVLHDLHFLFQTIPEEEEPSDEAKRSSLVKSLPFFNKDRSRSSSVDNNSTEPTNHIAVAINNNEAVINNNAAVIDNNAAVIVNEGSNL